MPGERFLVISDLQIPFEHSDALSFTLKTKRKYKIPDGNVLCVGDEGDQFWASLYKKDPDARHSAITELEAARKHFKPWFKHLPEMKLAISNHGTRWARKAFESEIPSQMIRSWQEMIEAPPGWVWKKRFLFKTKHPFILEHGDDWSGPQPHKTAAIHYGISTIIGHHHSISGIEYVRNQLENQFFGMCVGSLINFEEYAFNYARNAKFRPISSLGLIVDDGRQAILEVL